MLKNKNQPKSDERRNYYRILNVQPDASLEIIKNNYRTLLQKLRLHPDLGGKNWNASIINEAYNTLSKPLKRAEYDIELLQLYDLKSLARGNLDNNSNQQENYKDNNKDKHGNQRNFYRLFNIQADSPARIIKTSYLTLSKDPDVPKELLNMAYTILSNPDKRALYDKLLSKHSHGYALKKLTTHKQENITLHTYQQKEEKTSSANTEQASIVKAKRSRLSSEYGSSKQSYYQPVITQYCTFCKTPHNQSPCEHTAALCNECKSPLFPPSDAFLDQQRRDIIRISKDQRIYFYAYWPGTKMTGAIADISPTGIQLVSDKELAKEQVIKLDGEDFKAVGVVSYCKNNEPNGQQISGIQFLTVNFNKRKGQFLSESA